MKLGQVAATILGLLAFYLLSFGPVSAVARRVVFGNNGVITHEQSYKVVVTIYAPIDWAVMRYPAFARIIEWYERVWMPGKV